MCNVGLYYFQIDAREVMDAKLTPPPLHPGSQLIGLKSMESDKNVLGRTIRMLAMKEIWR